MAKSRDSLDVSTLEGELLQLKAPNHGRVFRALQRAYLAEQEL